MIKQFLSILTSLILVTNTTVQAQPIKYEFATSIIKEANIDFCTKEGVDSFLELLKHGSDWLEPFIGDEDGKLYVKVSDGALDKIQFKDECSNDPRFDIVVPQDGVVLPATTEVKDIIFNNYSTLPILSLSEQGIPFDITEAVRAGISAFDQKNLVYVIDLEDINRKTEVRLGVWNQDIINNLGKSSRNFSAYNAETIQPYINVQIMQTEDSYERICFDWDIDAVVYNSTFLVFDIIENMIDNEQCFVRR